MKIQNTSNLQISSKNQSIQNNQNNSQMAFKGDPITTALNFVQTNQAVGATLVDAGCMCTPRTVVDFSRSYDAGVETARREFSSNVNDGALGAYGMGAAYLLAKSFNNKYNVRADKMFVDSESLAILSDIKAKNGDIRKEENLKNYINTIADSISGFNPNNATKDGSKGWVALSEDAKSKESFVNKLVSSLTEEVPEKQIKKHMKDTTASLKALVLSATGAENEVRFEHNKISSVTSVDDLVDNVYKMSKAFKTDAVLDEAGNVKEDFIKGLKKIHTGTAIAGLGACMAVGASVQPINMYLTKKKTGKEGFVGVEGREPDKSNGFKFMKLGAAAAALYGALFTITNKAKISPAAVLERVKFKGIVPTLNQFKLVYGVTIVSRLLSARDKNELREASIKDSLGFTNWLILGAFASKLAAIGLEKLDKFKSNGIKFINYNAANSTTEKGKVLPKWLSASIVSREEAIAESMKKHGVSAFKDVDGKKVAKSFAERFADAVKADPNLKLRNRYLGAIQFIGYAWSGLALGIGVPKLNIAITNAVENKHKKAEAKTEENKAA